MGRLVRIRHKQVGLAAIPDTDTRLELEGPDDQHITVRFNAIGVVELLLIWPCAALGNCDAAEEFDADIVHRPNSWLACSTMKASDVIAIVSIVLTAATAIGVMLWTSRAAIRARRQETTFEMHREFNAPELTHSRDQAGKTVRDERYVSKNYDWMRRNLDTKVVGHVWNVIYFYQRLWLAIDHKIIAKKLVPDLFGETFYWWYDKSYKDQLIVLKEKKEWQASRDIAELWNCIEKTAEESDKSRWRDRTATMADPKTWKHRPIALKRRNIHAARWCPRCHRC